MNARSARRGATGAPPGGPPGGRLRGEEGQILPVALAFLVLFGVAIAAVLGLASTNLRATVEIREQRHVAYAADGAMDGAIQFVRADRTRGAAGGACPQFVATLNATTVTVTCERIGSVLELDRRIRFVATAGGRTRLEATVTYRDVAAGAAEPRVDVLRWRYLR